MDRFLSAGDDVSDLVIVAGSYRITDEPSRQFRVDVWGSGCGRR